MYTHFLRNPCSEALYGTSLSNFRPAHEPYPDLYFAPGLRHAAIPRVELDDLRRRVGHTARRDDNVQLQAWLASRGIASSLHYSQQHNFIVHLEGSRRVTLLPPQCHREARLFPFWHGSFRHARDGELWTRQQVVRSWAQVATHAPQKRLSSWARPLPTMANMTS